MHSYLQDLFRLSCVLALEVPVWATYAAQYRENVQCILLVCTTMCVCVSVCVSVCNRLATRVFYRQIIIAGYGMSVGDHRVA